MSTLIVYADPREEEEAEDLAMELMITTGTMPRILYVYRDILVSELEATLAIRFDRIELPIVADSATDSILEDY